MCFHFSSSTVREQLIHLFAAITSKSESLAINFERNKHNGKSPSTLFYNLENLYNADFEIRPDFDSMLLRKTLEGYKLHRQGLVAMAKSFQGSVGVTLRIKNLILESVWSI